MVARFSREHDDKWVTALDSGGAAQVGAVIGVDALRGNVRGKEERGRRVGSEAENRDCPGERQSGEEGDDEAKVEEKPGCGFQHCDDYLRLFLAREMARRCGGALLVCCKAIRCQIR